MTVSGLPGMDATYDVYYGDRTACSQTRVACDIPADSKHTTQEEAEQELEESGENGCIAVNRAISSICFV